MIPMAMGFVVPMEMANGPSGWMTKSLVRVAPFHFEMRLRLLPAIRQWNRFVSFHVLTEVVPGLSGGDRGDRTLITSRRTLSRGGSRLLEMNGLTLFIDRRSGLEGLYAFALKIQISPLKPTSVQP
jgi:hypothetical protein